MQVRQQCPPIEAAVVASRVVPPADLPRAAITLMERDDAEGHPQIPQMTQTHGLGRDVRIAEAGHPPLAVAVARNVTTPT
jgi:hypothetical protein